MYNMYIIMIIIIILVVVVTLSFIYYLFSNLLLGISLNLASEVPCVD